MSNAFYARLADGRAPLPRLAVFSLRLARHTNLSSHMALERHTSALPPAQPSYILRGHTAQIHSVRFVRHNSRLLTGDADGCIVYWKLETKRAIAVWKAHDGAILGTEQWGRDRFITQGRDNTLRIWQLRVVDEGVLSTVLPADDQMTPRPKPWLLYTLPVNTLNFCGFSMCHEQMRRADKPSHGTNDAVLIATVSTDDKKINVYQFPEEKLKYVVPQVPTTDTGMVMAVKLVHHPVSQAALILSGYEGGLTAIHQLPPGDATNVRPAQLIYLSQPHSQPILSLDVSPDAKTFYTSSADAVIASHVVPDIPCAVEARQEGAVQRGNYQATSNEESSNSEVVSDAQNKVSSSTCSSAEHGSSIPLQSTSLSFTKQPIASSQKQPIKTAGLSSLLSSASPSAKVKLTPPTPSPRSVQLAHKTTNTKHSGQQSLRVRSDGRIFATGGWDSRIRIYSSKTLKEVATLKWHKEGVYAVDFAQVLVAEDLKETEEQDGEEQAVTQTGLGKLQRQREEQMQLKHWIVAGAKDGKVSLWEIF